MKCKSSQLKGQHLRKPNRESAATTPQQLALWVRVTGQLMFDSEHFLRKHLVRVNNWEIHPVMKMEYSTTGSNCTMKGDTGWKSIDDL